MQGFLGVAYNWEGYMGARVHWGGDFIIGVKSFGNDF